MILISVISPELIQKSCCFLYAGIYADMYQKYKETKTPDFSGRG